MVKKQKICVWMIYLPHIVTRRRKKNKKIYYTLNNHVPCTKNTLTNTQYMKMNVICNIENIIMWMCLFHSSFITILNVIALNFIRVIALDETHESHLTNIVKECELYKYERIYSIIIILNIQMEEAACTHK